MNILSKYEGYEPKSNIDMSGIPYANMVMGVLENETIESIQNSLDYIDTIERLYNWGNKTKVKFRRFHA